MANYFMPLAIASFSVGRYGQALSGIAGGEFSRLLHGRGL